MMNLNKVCLVLGLVLVSFTNAAYLKGADAVYASSNTVICDAESRSSDLMCLAVISDYGCVHYADGSQKYIPVNPCTCQNTEVVSYDVNKQCEAQNLPQIDDHYLCREDDRNVQCFSYLLTPGCKCTSDDGVCVDTQVDRCNECSDPNVYAVAAGKTCAEIISPEIETVPTPKTVVCDAESRSSDLMCLAVIGDYGCVHYADGSQKYIPVNPCICQNVNVISYDVNKQCEAQELPQIDDQYLCGEFDRNVQCFVYSPIPGCKCTSDDGVCVDTQVDKCNDCADPNVYAVAAGKTCAEIISPEIETVQTPKTVVCDAESRSSDLMCLAVIGDYGCVHYADGSQKYIPVNPCTCQNTEVVSYDVNKQCEAQELPQIEIISPEVETVPTPKTVVCDAESRSSDLMCLAVISDYGCVHYADGSQKYIPVNPCICQNVNVISYDVNKECPPQQNPLFSIQNKIKKIIKKIVKSLTN